MMVGTYLQTWLMSSVLAGKTYLGSSSRGSASLMQVLRVSVLQSSLLWLLDSWVTLPGTMFTLDGIMWENFGKQDSWLGSLKPQTKCKFWKVPNLITQFRKSLVIFRFCMRNFRLQLLSLWELKVALSQKILENFSVANINIPNHYSEQKTWISCLLF